MREDDDGVGGIRTSIRLDRDPTLSVEGYVIRRSVSTEDLEVRIRDHTNRFRRILDVGVNARLSTELFNQRDPVLADPGIPLQINELTFRENLQAVTCGVETSDDVAVASKVKLRIISDHRFVHEHLQRGSRTKSHRAGNRCFRTHQILLCQPCTPYVEPFRMSDGHVYQLDDADVRLVP